MAERNNLAQLLTQLQQPQQRSPIQNIGNVAQAFGMGLQGKQYTPPKQETSVSNQLALLGLKEKIKASQPKTVNVGGNLVRVDPVSGEHEILFTPPGKDPTISDLTNAARILLTEPEGEGERIPGTGIFGTGFGFGSKREKAELPPDIAALQQRIRERLELDGTSIKVRRISDGVVGTINENEFDPEQFERI